MTFKLNPNPARAERTEEQKAEARKWIAKANATRRPSRPDLRSAPLRQVVETGVVVNVSTKLGEYEMNVLKWKLECGHLVSPPQDIYGERFPEKMRCGECRNAANSQASEW